MVWHIIEPEELDNRAAAGMPSRQFLHNQGTALKLPSSTGAAVMERVPSSQLLWARYNFLQGPRDFIEARDQNPSLKKMWLRLGPRALCDMQHNDATGTPLSLSLVFAS